MASPLLLTGNHAFTRMGQIYVMRARNRIFIIPKKSHLNPVEMHFCKGHY
jgi:hypothetical protein